MVLPAPWRAEVGAFALRPGGAFEARMHGPEGESQHGAGCFLEVVPGERIVFTSVFGEGWRPLIASNEGCDLGDGTLYAVRVLHANADDMRRHAEMGFEPGWGAVIAQLEEVARRLSAEPA